MGEAKRKGSKDQRVERAKRKLDRFIHLLFILMRETDIRTIIRLAEIRGMRHVKV